MPTGKFPGGGTGLRRKQGPPDFVLFITTLMLIAIGVIMVFSSSSVTANVRYHDPYYFFKRQVLWVAIALPVMWVVTKVNYSRLKDLAVPALIVALVCLILVLFTPSVKGSTRWLGVGFLRFNPSEMAKLCLVLFLASSLSQNTERLSSLTRGIFPYVLFIGVICLLVMMQPDLGTTFIILVTALTMLAMAGARMTHMGLLGMAGAVLVAVAIFFESYRLKRFLAFLDPWKDPSGSGFQTIQSLYALGSGGLFGMGLGRSRQKFFYLPEQHTDFIFAILGEELGFLGTSLVLMLFLLLAWRGYRIALNAPDNFGALLAAGITTMIVFQAAVNIGVVSGVLPVTGIPLPFISYGGSSLLFILIGVGLLLNISRYAGYR